MRKKNSRVRERRRREERRNLATSPLKRLRRTVSAMSSAL